MLLLSGGEVGLYSVINQLHYATILLANKCLIQINTELKNDLSNTCKMQL